MRRLAITALLGLLTLTMVGPAAGPALPGGPLARGAGALGVVLPVRPAWSPPPAPGLPGLVIPDLGQRTAAGGASSPGPTPAGVSRTLDGLLAAKALGSEVAAQVVDLSTGAVLFQRRPDRPAVPASTAKILTAAAALAALGPTTTLATTAVGGATPQQVVLVGGGDVLLAPGHGDPLATNGHAGIADLAAATAQRLLAGGVHAVAVILDDTLFPGPAASPRWPAADLTGGYVAPVSALAVDAGNATPGRRPRPGEPFARVGDPALSAAQRFAVALTAAGVTVTGPVGRGQAPSGATPLAEVRSAPVARLVEQALTDSDNTVGEVLARLVAVRTGQPADFAGAGAAVLARLAGLGIPVGGQAMAGGSGLGSGYALSPATLTEVLALAASDRHPELRAVLTGLPVAGASGTLADRFTAARDRPAIGVVRAKTGTLTGASSLAGTVVDADGRLLAFAVLADQVTSTRAARAALDDVGAALAACGCN